MASSIAKCSGMFPPGVGFYPEDEELVSHYLQKKVSGSPDGENFRFIKDISLYDHEPSELSRLAHDSGHSKRYFFTRLQRRNQQGNTINRKTPNGFWKKTGPPHFIKDEAGTQVVATKTSLTYYMKDEMSNRSEKTCWLMKEYMLVESQPSNQNDEERELLTSWTLCVVYLGKTPRRNRNGTN